MQLFTLDKIQLFALKEKPFKLEKEIQDLFETNLRALTGWRLIASEFKIKANRFDTIAFDEEMKAFVIIEYKRDRNFSVIDQGVSYLNTMLEYKADFIVEYNESQQENLKRSDVDWSQSKIIFVSPSFTDFQKHASNFKDLPIDLWEIKQFENNIILVNPVKKSKEAPAIREVKIAGNSAIEKVAREVKVYSEEDHLVNKSYETKELYELFREGILKLDNGVELKPKKMEIGFTKEGKVFADICIQKSTIKLWINVKKGFLDDPKGLSRDVSEIGHWGNGDYEVVVSDTSNLEYIMSLIKQGL